MGEGNINQADLRNWLVWNSRISSRLHGIASLRWKMPDGTTVDKIVRHALPHGNDPSRPFAGEVTTPTGEKIYIIYRVGFMGERVVGDVRLGGYQENYTIIKEGDWALRSWLRYAQFHLLNIVKDASERTYLEKQQPL